MDYVVPEIILSLNTEQFCACYSCYRLVLREFVLVHVTLHFGIKLFTRYIYFSSEIKDNTFQKKKNSEY